MPWDIDAAFNEFDLNGSFPNVGSSRSRHWLEERARNSNPIRDALCELDRRGQKTRAAIMTTTKIENVSEITAGIIREITGAGDATLSSEAIIDRCVIPMINEAVFWKRIKRRDPATLMLCGSMGMAGL